jgi:hypothetical protein
MQPPEIEDAIQDEEQPEHEITKEELILKVSGGYVFRYLYTEEGEPYFKKEFLRISSESLKFFDIDVKRLIREWLWSDIQEIAPLTSHPLGFQITTVDNKTVKFLSECEGFKEYYLRLFSLFYSKSQQKTTTDSSQLDAIQENKRSMVGSNNQQPCLVNTSSQVTSPCIINDLPPEMLRTILFHVRDLKSLGVLCQTCKTWNKYISEDKFFGEFWRSMFYSRFAEMQVGLKNPSWKNILRQRLVAESQRDNVPVAISPTHTVVQLGNGFQTWRVNVGIWGGKWYYEVKTVRCMTANQIGFLGISCRAKPWGLTMTGVGDDEFSYCYDPIRHCTFYKEIETQQYGTSVTWKNGDIVGCMLDLDNREISFSLNGQFLGVAHRNIQTDHCPYFAGFSIYGHDSTAEFILKSSEMKYGPPPEYKAIGDCIPEGSILIEWIVGKQFLQNWMLNKTNYMNLLLEKRKTLVTETDTMLSASCQGVATLSSTISQSL